VITELRERSKSREGQNHMQKSVSMQSLPQKKESMREKLNSLKKQQSIIEAAATNQETLEDRVM